MSYDAILFNNILGRLCALESASGLVATSLSQFSDSTGQGLGGVQDGANKLFTVAATNYQAGSLIATVGNNTYSAGNGLLETSPSTGQFQFVDAPLVADLITVYYSAIDTGVINISDAGIHAENSSVSLDGAVDGVNTLFTTSRTNYKPGSTLVISGGNVLSAGNGYTESSPGNGEFTLDVAPTIGQVVQIIYQDENATGIITKVDSTMQGVVGIINGINQTFQVSNGAYQPGSLYAVVAGNYYTAGNGLTESSPGTGSVTFTVAPIVGDLMYIFYQLP